MNKTLGSIALLVMVLATSACEDERQKQLREMWAAAVETDTIDAYLAFLAEPDRQRNAKVGEHTPYDDKNATRTFVAERRIFELAYQDVRGSCPFTSLRVALQQDIQHVEAKFDASKWIFGPAMELLGVELVAGPGPADETIILNLGGRGLKGWYVFSGKGEVPAILGGYVWGRMDVLTRPDLSFEFEAGSDASTGIVGFEDVGPGLFPVPLVEQMNWAGIPNHLAVIVYELCGPKAGALLYFNSDAFGPCEYPPSRDGRPNIDLANKLLLHKEDLRLLTIAATLGATRDNLVCYSISKKAMEHYFLAYGREAGQNLAKAYGNIYGNTEWVRTLID